MSDNAEEGIARTQVAAARAQGIEADGLNRYQKWSIAYLDERILIFVLVIAFLGLMVVWATAASDLVVYGSVVVIVVLAIVWGITRIKGIERARQERQQQANQWRSGNPD